MSENPYKTPEHASEPQDYQNSDYGPVRDLSTLASLSKVMLVLNIVITIAAVGFTMSSHYQEALASAVIETDDGSDAFETLMALGVAALIVFIITVIAICMWTHRAMSNTWAIGKIKPSTTPGWAVGWYFIPIANLWKPYGAMSEIWSGVYGYSKSRAVLLVWWFSWIISNMLDRISMKMDLDQDTQMLDLVSGVLTVISAVFLMKIIGEVTKYQNNKVSGFMKNV